MIEYPIEPGQRMIVRPNNFPKFSDLAHLLICLGEVESTQEGIIAKECSYLDENYKVQYLDIPLFLLWRVADDEDLLAMHEAYVQSKFNQHK